MRSELQPYTYEEMAEIFQVKASTVRNWKHQGLFKIMGYRRMGKWAKEALVSSEEVKKLLSKKYTL